MKKIAAYFSLTILTIACATLLSSCNSKNSEPDPVPDPVPTIQKADVQYSISERYDLHSVADVSVTYIDAAGKSITEKVDSTPWKKEVKGITTPFTAKMTITVKRKTGVKYDKKSYKFGSGNSISYKKSSAEVYLASNSTPFEKGSGSSSDKTVEAKLIDLEKTPTTVSLAVPVLK